MAHKSYIFILVLCCLVGKQLRNTMYYFIFFFPFSLDCVKKLIKSGYKSMECKQEPFDKFHVSLFEQMKNRVFSVGGCSAWYLNGKGVNWTLWSGDLTEYWMKTRQCNLKDYLLR